MNNLYSEKHLLDTITTRPWVKKDGAALLNVSPEHAHRAFSLLSELLEKSDSTSLTIEYGVALIIRWEAEDALLVVNLDGIPNVRELSQAQHIILCVDESFAKQMDFSFARELDPAQKLAAHPFYQGIIEESRSGRFMN